MGMTGQTMLHLAGEKKLSKLEKKEERKTKQRINGSVAHLRPYCQHMRYATSLICYKL